MTVKTVAYIATYFVEGAKLHKQLEYCEYKLLNLTCCVLNCCRKAVMLWKDKSLLTVYPPL